MPRAVLVLALVLVTPLAVADHRDVWSVTDPAGDEMTRAQVTPWLSGVCHDPAADLVTLEAVRTPEAVVFHVATAAGASSLDCPAGVEDTVTLASQRVQVHGWQNMGISGSDTLFDFDVTWSEGANGFEACADYYFFLEAGGSDHLRTCAPDTRDGDYTWAIPLVAQWDLTQVADFYVWSNADTAHTGPLAIEVSDDAGYLRFGWDEP